MSELGLCPLCGGEAVMGTEIAVCPNTACEMPTMSDETWNRLSALAASERRMREALERMDLFAKDHSEMAVHEHDLDAADDWEWIRGWCREALKGGRG